MRILSAAVTRVLPLVLFAILSAPANAQFSGQTVLTGAYFTSGQGQSCTGTVSQIIGVYVGLGNSPYLVGTVWTTGTITSGGCAGWSVTQQLYIPLSLSGSTLSGSITYPYACANAYCQTGQITQSTNLQVQTLNGVTSLTGSIQWLDSGQNTAINQWTYSVSTSGQVTLTTLCGDDRDDLIAMYKDPRYNIKLHPGATGDAAYATCQDFTQTHPEFNVSTQCPQFLKKWEAVQTYLPFVESYWQQHIGGRDISSVYRNPDVNACVTHSSSLSKNSPHMHGYAVDLYTVDHSNTNPTEYEFLSTLAIDAGFDWTEQMAKGWMPCQLYHSPCVHGDMRNHQSPFINP